MNKRKSANLQAYHHGNLRDALIACAIKTIEEDGVEAVSLRALAREIGVSHAAPIRHFKTRAALLAAIAEKGIGALLESATQQIENPDLNGLGKLQAMSNGYLAWVIENPAHHMLIRNQDVMRHATKALLGEIDAYAQLHQRMIGQAQAEGWRKDEAARAIFVQLTAFTAGLALLASDPIYKTVFGKRLLKREITDALSDYFNRSVS